MPDYLGELNIFDMIINTHRIAIFIDNCYIQVNDLEPYIKVENAGFALSKKYGNNINVSLLERYILSKEK